MRNEKNRLGADFKDLADLPIGTQFELNQKITRTYRQPYGRITTYLRRVPRGSVRGV